MCAIYVGAPQDALLHLGLKHSALIPEHLCSLLVQRILRVGILHRLPHQGKPWLNFAETFSALAHAIERIRYQSLKSCQYTLPTIIMTLDDSP